MTDAYPNDAQDQAKEDAVRFKEQLGELGVAHLTHEPDTRAVDALDQIAANLASIRGGLTEIVELLRQRRDTVTAEAEQFRHATEVAGRAMHPALKVSAPKGFMCPGCQHDVNVHRTFGCDTYVGADLCACTAPYGRPPRVAPAQEEAAKTQMSLKDFNSGVIGNNEPR